MATGTAAAARGGYTTVCAMPNVDPAPDTPEHLGVQLDLIRRDARVEVLPYHTLGLFKWQKLGIPYPLPDAVPPTAEQVKRAEELLEVSRYPG